MGVLFFKMMSSPHPFYLFVLPFPGRLSILLSFLISWVVKFCFCKCPLFVRFLHLSFLLEHWIKHGTFGILYVKSMLSARIFYRRNPGFEIFLPCGVWYRGITTCSPYVSPTSWPCGVWYRGLTTSSPYVSRLFGKLFETIVGPPGGAAHGNVWITIEHSSKPLGFYLPIRTGNVLLKFGFGVPSQTEVRVQKLKLYLSHWWLIFCLASLRTDLNSSWL